MGSIADVLELLSKNTTLYDNEIKREISELANKRKLCYCYTEKVISEFHQFLHDNKF